MERGEQAETRKVNLENIEEKIPLMPAHEWGARQKKSKVGGPALKNRGQGKIAWEITSGPRVHGMPSKNSGTATLRSRIIFSA